MCKNSFNTISNMKQRFFITLLCLIPFIGITAQNSASTVLPQIDFRALISKSDLVYSNPVTTSEEGLPVGNGVMGTLVWTTPSSLRYQLNRVDVFANDETTNNFAQRHSDYCGGVGFLDIDFPGYDEVFSGNDFYQNLSCYEAITTANGRRVKTETFVWSDGDVMAVKVQDNRNGLPVVIRLRTLRPPTTMKGDHRAISTFQAEGTNQMALIQTFSEGDYTCKSAMAVTVAGAEAKVWQANDAEMTLTVKPSGAVFYVYVSSAATFDKDYDIAGDAFGLLAKAKTTGYDAMMTSHKQWWKNFWEQSMVNLTSADGIADNITVHYNFFMYLMGSTYRGEYQAKFNGMLWSTGGDRRQWGNQFWGANQSCFINGLFPANRPELMQPAFKMYTRMIPSLERAAVQQWGSKGIYIPETVGFKGLEDLPESIAAEMRDIYLARKPWSDVSPEFMQYAATKMPHNSRWNWKNDDGWKNGVWQFSDKGGGGFAQVNHIFSRGAKLAYQYWMQYEYNQDKKWLAEQAYPMVKGVAEFYRNFPNLIKEKNGKYFIRHVNDNESVWGGNNTVEEISSIMGLFPVAIKAATILNVDADLRKAWAEVLDNLSPLTLSTDFPELADRPVTFVRSLPPSRNELRAISSIHDLNTMPTWFFDLLTLESTDKELMQIANNTFDAYFRRGTGNAYSSQELSGINKDIRVGILSKLPVTGAQMGRVDATRYLIPSQIRYDGGSVMRNRLDLSEGAQTTNVQRLGRVADALHNALCQSIPAKPGEETIIRLFPAWPQEWDAQFTLLCRGNFLVTSSFRKGIIEFVEIKSQAGIECKIRNPWGTEEVTIYRNGTQFLKTKDNLIAFPTQVNEVFVLVKGDAKPSFTKIEKQMPLIGQLHLYTARDVPEVSVDEVLPAKPRNVIDKVTNPAWPGEGLNRHPMLYIGEGTNIMYIVNEGKVVWTFNTGDGWEYDDVWMMTNGNIVFSRQTWAGEITPQKRYVWRIDAEEDEEIHVTQPIGLDKVMLVVNGKPPKVKIYNKKTGVIEFEHVLDYEADKQVHAQFRRARITDKNTLLVPYLMMHKVVEYDLNDNFKPIWEYEVYSPWAAVRLKNGNTLITNERDKLTFEVNPKGETVWSFNLAELPEEYAMPNTQSCVRLDNGNTIICSRGNNGKAPQLVEITPDKKVVWVLDDWKNLGQATAVQILSESGIPENPGECER